MGKRHFKGGNTSEEKKRRKEAADKWASVRGDQNNRNPWVLVNDRFDAFYKAQGFLKGDEDFDAFLKHLQSPLPACFRIWPDYAFADELRNQMLAFVGKTLVLDENESVVAELLRNAKGGLELVDAREFLPLFKCRPGLTTWHVLDDFYAIKKEVKDRKKRTSASTEGAESAVAEESKETKEAAETEEATPAVDLSNITDPYLRECIEMGMTYHPDFASVPEHLSRKVRKSMFPPTEEEKAWMHLERCLRCVPQDEDTGGFFVATLRKVARPVVAEEQAPAAAPVVEEITAEEAEAAAVAAEAAEEGPAPQRQPRPMKGLVDFHQWDLDTFNRIKQFYGFTDGLAPESFYIREDFVTSAQANATTGAKSVYFIPPAARSLMLGDKDARLKVVTAGVKVFEKKVLRSGDVDYRLLQDGIAFLEPHITKRKVSVSIQDFCNMLGGGLVSFSTLSPEFVNALYQTPTGVLICKYTYRPEDVLLPEGSASAVPTTVHNFYAICWKGNTRAINVMCGK
eukprot:gene19869-22583_t